MSRVAVIGAGYVGLVTAACLADLGHDVSCADIVPEKVAMLSRGEIPLLEAGLDQLVRDGLAKGGLQVRAGGCSGSARPGVRFLVPSYSRAR